MDRSDCNDDDRRLIEGVGHRFFIWMKPGSNIQERKDSIYITRMGIHRLTVYQYTSG